MSYTLNRCYFTTSDVGAASTVTVLAAVDNSFLTPSQAGAVNGLEYTYLIQKGNDIELQQDQTWDSGNNRFSRAATPFLSKIGGTVGTAQLSLDASCTILVGPSARDIMFDRLRGADVASTATINLTTTTGKCIDITGTTTVTAVTLDDGDERLVRFTGVLTLTNGASLVLPGGANITTAAGDFATFRGYSGGVVRMTHFERANGKSVIGPAAADITDSTALGRAELTATRTTVPFSTAGNTVDASHRGGNVVLSGATDRSLAWTACATLGDGFEVTVTNASSAVWTHDPNGLETFEGLTSFKMYPGESWLVRCDGTKLYVIAGLNHVVKLQDVVISNQPTVDFNRIDTARFSTFEFELDGVVLATTNNEIYIRVSTDGGSSYVTTNTYYHQRSTGLHTGGSVAASGSGSDDKIAIVVGANNTNVIAGKVAAQIGVASSFSAQIGYVNNSTVVTQQSTIGNQASVANAIRFLTTTGNFTSGVIRLSGKRK